jgi:plasmid maintenance system antidote protein VapI
MYNSCKGGDKMNVKKSFKLKEAIWWHGYSLTTFSRLISISRVQLSHVAQGKNTTPGTAGKIARELGLSVSDIFDIKESM